MAAPTATPALPGLAMDDSDLAVRLLADQRLLLPQIRAGRGLTVDRDDIA